MSVLPSGLRVCGLCGASSRSPQHHGGSLEGVHRRKMNGSPEESAVINYSAEVPDQVQAKKQNEECNKRDAAVLEKLKVSSVEDIILESKTQILSIAGVEYASLSAKVRLYYCQEMGIMVPNKKRKKDEITELILNHVSGQVLKELVKQPMKKKAKASKTHLVALTKDGMLYRIINVICSMEGRALFLHTKRVLSCASLDIDLYRDISEYNMIDVLDQSQMVGYGVEDDAAMDFDELNLAEFKECLDFIMAHYQEAHNNNNKSASHQPFVDYTSRKPYLLYLHLWSAEIRDKAFSDCVYSALPSEAAFSSSTSSSPLTDDTTPEKSSTMSNKGREQSATNNLWKHKPKSLNHSLLSMK